MIAPHEGPVSGGIEVPVESGLGLALLFGTVATFLCYDRYLFFVGKGKMHRKSDGLLWTTYR